MKRNKSIVFVILSVLIGFVFSGCLSMDVVPLMEDERYISYIQEYPGISADTLFDAAYSVFRNEPSTRFDADLINKNKLVASKSVYATYSIRPVDTSYTLIVDIKDGKCRLVFRDMFMHREVRPAPIAYQDELDSFLKESDKIADTFQVKMIYYLSKPTNTSDDW